MLPPGQRLGEFEILECLGRGGMGEVYKARQISLGRFVALKTLQSSLADDADYIARFQQEARAAAGLSHPNLVQVYSAGDSDGLHWFAMEYVEGESAKVRLKRTERLDALEAIAIGIHVATALDYGWRKAGLIHRDISDNIFLSLDGEVKVGDLGLAKSVLQTEGITTSGASIGTPHYISPEQVDSMKDVDLRADIYSLGCTLYQFLSGHPPYEGNSAVGIMMKHVTAPVPDLHTLWPECPADLGATIAKMMQKDPADRQQNYGEVLEDLRRAYDQLSNARTAETVAATSPQPVATPRHAVPAAGGKGPRPPGKPRVPAVAWAGAGVALLAALAALIYFAPWKKNDAATVGQAPRLPTGESPPSQSASEARGSPVSQSPLFPSAPSALQSATKETPFENTLGMKFVPVPILGGPTGGQRVLFSVWDTRVQDYEAFVKETKREWPKPDFAQGPAHPAVMVSWGDAQDFCEWLTDRDRNSGKLGSDEVYRLPTDHEWSCAVGIGDREDAAELPQKKDRMTTDAFPWGSTWPPPKGAGNYAGEELRSLQADGKFKGMDLLSGYNDGFANTSPVGRFAANRLGLFDMGGNVWQWCQDWGDKDQTSRALRGGCWNNSDRPHLISSARYFRPPHWRGNHYGFRCVLVSASSAPPATAAPAALSSTPVTASKDKPFTNTLGMRFVPVPGTPVLFSIWDTRVKDYAAYATRVNQVDDAWTRQQKDAVPISRDPEYPVVGVSWDDANAFCQWLTKNENANGRLPAGMQYRLPTDEEWSRAVGLAKEDGATPRERSGKNTVNFPWGTDYPPKTKVGNYSDIAWHGKFPGPPWMQGYDDGNATTSRVGSYPANVYGLYDMGGNVQQWCEDWFDKDQKDRVLRGGAWTYFIRNALLSSNRIHYPPGSRTNDFGFRCVLAPDSTILPNAATQNESSNRATTAPTPAPTPNPVTEVEKWLAQVDGPQQAVFQKQVLKPFQTGLAELRAHYLASVDAAIARASAAGQLDDALAWRTERQAFVQGQNIATDGDNTPAAVKALRAAFRQQLARLDQDRTAQARALLAAYDAILAKYQTLLTQHQRFDDALLLNAKREAIARAWLAPWPLLATRENPFENTLGMKFVPVPIIGGPTGGQPVLFSVWDTRVQDYEVFVKETKRDWPKPDFEQGPTHPVVFVSWDDAQVFCQWLTAREEAAGRLPAGCKYRLPSDHEWSCAVGIGEREDAAKLPSEKNARIGDAFPWGTPWPPPKGAGNYAGEELQPALAEGKYSAYIGGRVMAGWNDGFANTSPVGSFAANPFGLYDMGGNAEQWCEDWLDKEQKSRVMRGASWGDCNRVALLSSHRGSGAPGGRYIYHGFRCVFALDVSAPPVRGAQAGPVTTPTVASVAQPTDGNAQPTHPPAPSTPILSAGPVNPANATKDAPFVNTLGMKFVPVPITGGPRGETIVLFSVWDTRVQDYEAFIKETRRGWGKPGFEQGPTHPAVGMLHEDAKLFCVWLTEHERKAGKLGADEVYRLPTDHEWSCAVGLGTRESPTKLPSEKNGKITNAFPWGTQWPPPKGAGNYAGEEVRPALSAGKYPFIKEVIVGYNDGFENTSPVGSYDENRFGLYDMGGNVQQWCEDWFDKEHKGHVLRGASWRFYDRRSLLSSDRGGPPPDYSYPDIGFRCVLGVAAP